MFSLWLMRGCLFCFLLCFAVVAFATVCCPSPFALYVG